MLQYQPDGKHQQRLLSPSSTKLSGDAHWHEGCSPLVCRAMHCQCRCLRTSSIIKDRFTGMAPSDGQLCVSDSKLTELSGGHGCRWPRGTPGPNELSWNHVQLCMSNNLEIISGQSEQDRKNIANVLMIIVMTSLTALHKLLKGTSYYIWHCTWK